MRPREGGAAERLRTKRLQEYKITYDKEARNRTKMLRQTESSNKVELNALDEEIQVNPLTAPSPLLYMDSYGNIGRRVPVNSASNAVDLWVSRRANACIPLLLTVGGVGCSHMSVGADTNEDMAVSIVLDKENPVPVPPSGECLVLCPSAEPAFIIAINYFILRLRVFTKSTDRVIGEVTARPFASANVGLCKASAAMHIVEKYPVVSNSEIVGSAELRIERLLHDYTVDTVQHFRINAAERPSLSKDVRRLLDAKTQTVGYFKQTLEERTL